MQKKTTLPQKSHPNQLPDSRTLVVPHFLNRPLKNYLTELYLNCTIPPATISGPVIIIFFPDAPTYSFCLGF